MAYEVGQTLYRARHRKHWAQSADGGERQYVEYVEFEVLRLTECGAWIRQKASWARKEKWITPQTVYVWSTKEDALESLKIRTRKYVGHCRRRLREAEERARNLGVDPAEAPQFFRGFG